MGNPTTATRPTEPRLLPPRWLAAGVVCILFLMVLGVQVSFKSVHKGAEVRTAAVAREMIASGNYMIPTEGGKPRYQKPPLPYWMIAFSTRAFGALFPEEILEYLPSLLGGTALLFLVWLWTRRLLDQAPPWIALIGPLVAVAFPIIFDAARSTEAEIMLTLFIVGAALFLQHSAESPTASCRYLLIAYLFMAGGLLTKGPFALIMPLLPYAVIYRHHLATTWRWHIVGFLIALTPILAWALGCYFHDPNVVHVFYTEMIAKRLGQGSHHVKPFYFYLEVIVTNIQYLLPVAVLAVWGGWRAGRRHRYLIAFAGLNLLWLSLMRTKQDHYAMPVFPVLAVLMGWGIVSANHRRAMRVYAWSTGIALVLVWTCMGSFLLPGSLGLLVAGVTAVVIVVGRRDRIPLPGLWLGVFCLIGGLHLGDMFIAVSAQRLIPQQLASRWLRAQAIPEEDVIYVGAPQELAVYYWGKPFATATADAVRQESNAKILITHDQEALAGLAGDSGYFTIRSIADIKRGKAVPRMTVLARQDDVGRTYLYRFIIVPESLEPGLRDMCERVPALMAANSVIPVRNPFTRSTSIIPFIRRRLVEPYEPLLRNGVDMPARLDVSRTVFTDIWFHDASMWGLEPGPVISRQCFAGQTTIYVIDGNDLPSATQELERIAIAKDVRQTSIVLIQDPPAPDDPAMLAFAKRLDEWGIVNLNQRLGVAPDHLACLTISAREVTLEFRDGQGTVKPLETQHWPLPIEGQR